MNLAILGHATRGKEVKKILEMLGGNNKYEIISSDEEYFYFIKSNGTIDLFPLRYNKGFMVFTLEEFLEKFPYKVGDKVVLANKDIVTITNMYWDNVSSQVIYEGESNTREYDSMNASSLQPYKEEPMEEKKDLDWYPTDYLDFVDNDDTWADEVELNLGDSYEIQVRDGKTFAVKKKPQYPKTYDECKSIIVESEGCDAGPAAIAAEVFANIPVTDFCKLIVVRNAYWKIAGDWKYDVNKTEEYFYIVNKCGCIVKEHYMNFNHILVFPTEEMRNAFYENFKELIEQCKELL